MEDSEIVALYLARDQEAPAATAEKYGSFLLAVASNVLSRREDAEEAVNDAYAAAWEAIPPHRPESLKAFLATLVRRAALNKYTSLRAEKRGGGEAAVCLDELEECLAGHVSVERELEARELSQAIGRFVKALPETERRVFLLRYWYVESIDSIMKKSGFSRSKIKSMLQRTRQRLKAYLIKEDFL